MTLNKEETWKENMGPDDEHGNCEEVFGRT